MKRSIPHFMLGSLLASVAAILVVSGNHLANGQPPAAANPPVLPPTFKAPMLYDSELDPTGKEEGNKWIRTELDNLFRPALKPNNKRVLLPAFFPLITPDQVIFRAYDGVHCYMTRDAMVHGHQIKEGELFWHSPSSMGLHQLVSKRGDDPDVKRHVLEWWSEYQRNGADNVLCENPLLGSLSQDGKNVYYIDDLALQPPPVQIGFPAKLEVPFSGFLAEAIKASRLIAIDLKTGKRAWTLGRIEESFGQFQLLEPPHLNDEESAKFAGAFVLCCDALFLAPPLPFNGKLYALIKRAGAIMLLCLDPGKLVQGFPGRQGTVPELLWSKKISERKPTRSEDAIRRIQGAFLAAAEEIILCPTNSGSVVAVDLATHKLLWTHTYRKPLPIEDPAKPAEPLAGQAVVKNLLPKERWRAAAPIISGGRVIMTAYDSNKLECLDLRTGKLIWETPRKTDDLYVGGVANDKVLVVGKNKVRAYHLDKIDPKNASAPELAWETKESIPTPTGHGALGKSEYFLPVRNLGAGEGHVSTAEIWAINVNSGAIRTKTAIGKAGENADLAKFGLGNLVIQDGIMAAQSAIDVHVILWKWVLFD